MKKNAGEGTPRKLYVELTTECNLDCAMCIRRSWNQPGGQMAPATFRNILRQLKDLPGLDTLNFSGYGEPSVHPCFFDFLAWASDDRLRTEVVTNGLFLNDSTVDRLLRLGLGRLIVSVDGIHSTSSEHLHPIPFDTVAAALRRLHERKRALHLARPDVWIEFVASRRNIHELPRLKARATVLGFSGILVTNLIPHTPELTGEILYRCWSTLERQRVPPSPYNPFVDLPLMDACAPARDAVERLRDASTHLRVNGYDVSGAPPRCPFVTQDRLAVRFDGNVSPCLPLLHPHTYFLPGRSKRVAACHVGNVNETSLKDIWNADGYQALRERVRNFEFSTCLSCGGCDLRASNQRDCTGDEAPRCGECLWAMGLVQCP